VWGSFISDAQQHCSYATDWPQSLLRCWSKKYQLSGWQAGGCLERTTSKFQVNLSLALIVTFATCNMTDNQLLYCQRFLLLPSHCSSGGRGGVALTSHQVLSATVASSVLHATPLADTNYVQGNQHDSTLCTADRCASVFVSSLSMISILDGIFIKLNYWYNRFELISVWRGADRSHSL
jgi:hypothetical protein